MTGVTGRVVLVTGAAGSAGTAATRALAAAGATVVAVGRSAERLTAMARIIPGIGTEVVDLTSEPAVAAFADRVHRRHGSVDGLVHLVGGYRGGATFGANNDADWAFLSAGLIESLRHVTLAFHDNLAASSCGRAVIVSARSASAPTAGSANYSAAKAAAEAWMLAFADSLRRIQTARDPEQSLASAATILVIKALVDEQLRAQHPERRFPGFTDVDELATRIVGLWSMGAAELNGARITVNPG